MDNACEHSPDQAITQHTTDLLTNYNIGVTHQVPWSPYTNDINMGVWGTLQATVEHKYVMKHCNIEALVNLMHDIYSNNTLDNTL